MSLELQVNEGIKAAMLGRQEATLRGLRAIKAAILVARTSEDRSAGLDAGTELRLLQKLVKQRKESLAIFRQQNRADLALKEEEELAVIEKFLPPQISEEDLKQAVQEIIARVAAHGLPDMGKVMAVASRELAGKADGKTLSSLVRSLLGGLS